MQLSEVHCVVYRENISNMYVNHRLSQRVQTATNSKSLIYNNTPVNSRLQSTLPVITQHNNLCKTNNCITSLDSIKYTFILHSTGSNVNSAQTMQDCINNKINGPKKEN